MIQRFYFWVFIWRKQTHDLKSYVHPSVHNSIIYNNLDMEAT